MVSQADLEAMQQMIANEVMVKLNEERARDEAGMGEIRKMVVDLVDTRGRGGAAAEEKLDHQAARILKPREWKLDGDRDVLVLGAEIKAYLTGLHREGEELYEDAMSGNLDEDIMPSHHLEMSKHLGLLLQTTVKGSARDIIATTPICKGLTMWRRLVHFASPRTAADKTAAMELIQRPKSAKTEKELAGLIQSWIKLVKEYETRFEAIPDAVLINSVKELVPDDFYRTNLRGKTWTNVWEMLRAVDSILKDTRLRDVSTFRSTPKKEEQPVPMELDSLRRSQGAQDWEFGEESCEDLGAIYNESDWEYRNGRWYKKHTDGKGKGKGKAGKGGQKGGFGEFRGKRPLECYNCGGIGHPARLCPTEQGKGKGKGRGHGVKGGSADLAEAWSQEDDVHDEEDACEDLACLMSVDAEQGHHKNGKGLNVLRITLDSGASANVIPTDMFPDIPLQESEGSRKGQYWISADGTKIYNEGQKEVRFTTRKGRKMKIMFQVGKVTKPLLSAFKVAEFGNEVLIKKDKAEIANRKTGASIDLRRENGVFVFEVDTESPVFRRLGA